MARLNDSFIDSLKLKLIDTNFSKSDFSFDSPKLSNGLISISFKYIEDYTFHLVEEKKSKKIVEKGAYSSLLGGAKHYEDSEHVFAIFSPGRFKVSDKIELNSIEETEDHIIDWCENIYREINHRKETLSPLEELRQQLEKQEVKIENEHEAASQDELINLSKKFDELLKKFQAMQEENHITKQDLEDIKSELATLKGSAQNIPKGIWAKMAKNKVIDLVVRFAKTKEAKDLAITSIKKYIES